MKNSEAILVTPKHFEIQECPVPEPKDHEILMKVEYVGMCGSDIHGFEFGVTKIASEFFILYPSFHLSSFTIFPVPQY